MYICNGCKQLQLDEPNEITCSDDEKIHKLCDDCNQSLQDYLNERTQEIPADKFPLFRGITHEHHEQYFCVLVDGSSIFITKVLDGDLRCYRFEEGTGEIPLAVMHALEGIQEITKDEFEAEYARCLDHFNRLKF